MFYKTAKLPFWRQCHASQLVVTRATLRDDFHKERAEQAQLEDVKYLLRMGKYRNSSLLGDPSLSSYVFLEAS